MELETPTPQVFYKDFPQICRLCLTTENLKSIYSDSVILNAFKYIPSIKVKQDDKLPQNICTNCMTKLEEIHEFIKKCEDNDALLKAVVPQENLQEASSIPNWPRPIKQETIDVDRFESVELNQFKEEVGENVENIVFEIVGDEVSLNGEVKTETTEESGKKEDDVLSGSPKKVFSCKYCGKKFKRFTSLQYHICARSEMQSLTCKHCNEKFLDVTELGAHNCLFVIKSVSAIISNKKKKQTKALIRQGKLRKQLHTDTDIKLFNCNVCNKKFTQKCALNRHSQLHTGRFKCEICDQPFTRETQLKSHMEKGHSVKEGSKSLVCKFCGKNYSSKLYLTLHLKSHVEVNAFQCEICNKTFSLKTLLNRHYFSHPEYKKFMCEICDKGFRSGISLKEHMNWHKLGFQANQTCHLCGKMYQLPGRLRQHLLLYHNVDSTTKPQDTSVLLSQPVAFTCATCDKEFPTKPKLLLHIKRHVGKKIYQCEICGNNYAYKDSLTQHLLSHKGEKPYRCPYCGKAFQRMGFYKHIRIHKAAKDLKCTICDKAFYRKDLLAQHLTIHKPK